MYVVGAGDGPRGDAGGRDLNVAGGVYELQLQPVFVLEIVRVIVGALIILGVGPVDVFGEERGGGLRLGLQGSAGGRIIVGPERDGIGEHRQHHKHKYQTCAHGHAARADGMKMNTFQPRQFLPRLLFIRRFGFFRFHARRGREHPVQK